MSELPAGTAGAATVLIIGTCGVAGYAVAWSRPRRRSSGWHGACWAPSHGVQTIGLLLPAAVIGLGRPDGQARWPARAPLAAGIRPWPRTGKRACPGTMAPVPGEMGVPAARLVGQAPWILGLALTATVAAAL